MKLWSKGTAHTRAVMRALICAPAMLSACRGEMDEGLYSHGQVQVAFSVCASSGSGADCGGDDAACRSAACDAGRSACGGVITKSVNPDEDLLWDVNLYVFGEGGLLEEHVYQTFGSGNSSSIAPLQLLKGRSWTLYAVANAGRKLEDMSRPQLEAYKLYIAYPDGFTHGIPMAGRLSDVTVGESSQVTVPLRRMISKLSLRMDRSRLDSDACLAVSQVKVGNCPRCASPFSENCVRTASDVFPSGFAKSGAQVSTLNSDAGSSSSASGVSGEVELYLLENVPQEPSDTVFCPYVEILADYRKTSSADDASVPVTLRFRLRRDDGYRVLRNSHYHVTVRPHMDAESLCPVL